MGLDQLGAEQIRQIGDQVWRQIIGIAVYYDDRMAANVASDGAEFLEEKLITDDLSTCNGVLQTAKDFIAALK
ncbi:hypothetical protein OCH239_13050 [Roseivivax halodurans JCM 10272]|uniref:Uncharacterized protein n=1 Tax=Roseivivax halodurans JCM 10272 TaxID=1449350 RepID=X7EBA7_9RHOB|nr:hypothetical protein [Roseivivax halodurans]ETX13155.1 hypothetical protein OCH239_13050 [Roseivivax halodurans JCM 10272]